MKVRVFGGPKGPSSKIEVQVDFDTIVKDTLLPLIKESLGDDIFDAYVLFRTTIVEKRVKPTEPLDVNATLTSVGAQQGEVLYLRPKPPGSAGDSARGAPKASTPSESGSTPRVPKAVTATVTPRGPEKTPPTQQSPRPVGDTPVKNATVKKKSATAHSKSVEQFAKHMHEEILKEVMWRFYTRWLHLLAAKYGTLKSLNHSVTERCSAVSEELTTTKQQLDHANAETADLKARVEKMQKDVDENAVLKLKIEEMIDELKEKEDRVTQEVERLRSHREGAVLRRLLVQRDDRVAELECKIASMRVAMNRMKESKHPDSPAESNEKDTNGERGASWAPSEPWHKTWKASKRKNSPRKQGQCAAMDCVRNRDGHVDPRNST